MFINIDSRAGVMILAAALVVAAAVTAPDATADTVDSAANAITGVLDG